LLLADWFRVRHPVAQQRVPLLAEQVTEFGYTLLDATQGVTARRESAVRP